MSRADRDPGLLDISKLNLFPFLTPSCPFDLSFILLSNSWMVDGTDTAIEELLFSSASSIIIDRTS